jgi:hypothetical protein
VETLYRALAERLAKILAIFAILKNIFYILLYCYVNSERTSIGMAGSEGLKKNKDIFKSNE